MARVPERYGSVVQTPDGKGWNVKVANPGAMTPLSQAVYDDIGNRVFWTKEQAEKALYAIYTGDPGDF